MCTLDLQIYDFISRLLFLYNLNSFKPFVPYKVYFLDNLFLSFMPLITLIFDPQKVLPFYSLSTMFLVAV